VFQPTAVLFIIAGAIGGVIAFGPFYLTLKPVLSNKQNADMLKGMGSLAISAIALLVFTLIVYALFGMAFQMFLLGEAIGFVAALLCFTVAVVLKLKEPGKVER
jgi:Mg2+ and Co2+ transporter CorA